MTAADPFPRGHEELARQLQPTAHCVPIERFGDDLTENERDHLGVCTRCQAEYALWQRFLDAPLPEEQADVQWVVQELQRKRDRRPTVGVGPVGASSPRRFRAGPLVAAAASVALAVVAGYLLWSPEPAVNVTKRTEVVYRTASVEVVAPVGDLRRAPQEFVWETVPGAVNYDVRVYEVDGNTLWSTSTPAAGVNLPAALVAQFVPAKTILWEVAARNSAGTRIALSGPQRFRVLVASVPRRD